MKNLITTFAILLFATNTYAQESANTEKKYDPYTNQHSGYEYGLMYAPESETFGFNIGGDLSNTIFHYNWGIMSNFKSASSDTGSTLSSYVEVGVHRRILFNDTFMINMALAPYISYSTLSYTVDETRNSSYNGKPYTVTKNIDDSDFSFGATAEVTTCFRISEKNYIHFGYKVFAGEFKTKELLKNGYIKIGISHLIKWF